MNSGTSNHVTEDRFGFMPKAARLAFLFLALLFLSGCAGELAEDAFLDEEPEVQPAVLLGGTQNVRFGLHCPVTVRAGESYALQAEDGALYPLKVAPGGLTGQPEFELAQVPSRTSCCALVRQSATSAPEILCPKSVKIVRRFRILLSFDDGPATGGNPDDGDPASSPTLQVLDALDQFRHGPGDSRQGVKAVFFLLTQPDHFLRDAYRKGETADGATLIREEAKRGHVLGAHWGGDYFGQTVTHPRRAMLPPYNYAGRDIPSAMPGENALECDLRECMNRISALTGRTSAYVRPPLWKYYDKDLPGSGKLVAATYRKLGLKMILTDARYPDGGYAVISVFLPNANQMFRKNIRTAFLSGEDMLIFSMHDSNTFTAQRLPRILQMIGQTFEKMNFGGQSGKAGDYLEFADTTQKVTEILDAKRRFMLFPRYSPAPDAR